MYDPRAPLAKSQGEPSGSPLGGGAGQPLPPPTWFPPSPGPVPHLCDVKPPLGLVECWPREVARGTEGDVAGHAQRPVPAGPLLGSRSSPATGHLLPLDLTLLTNFKIYLLLFTVYTWSFILTVSFDPQSPARGPHAPILQWGTLRLSGGTVHQMGQQGSRTQRGPPLPAHPVRLCSRCPPWAHAL